MSLITPRVALQTSALSPSAATSFTASYSPWEMHANPASMTSTPSVSMALATLSFFSGVRDIPGVCSPSRRVVSRNFTCFGKSVNKAIPHVHSLCGSIYPSRREYKGNDTAEETHNARNRCTLGGKGFLPELVKVWVQLGR
jgi:hypothetical protein